MKRLILALACLTFLAAGCSRPEEKSRTPEAVVVSTTVPVKQSYRPVLRYTGTAYANKEANLATTLPGKVEKMNCSEGMNVAKGAVLAELSGELLTEAIIENNALKKDLDRLQRLGEKGSMSQIEIDHLKAKYDASQAKVELLRKNTEIIAPFSGTVVDINVNEGETFSLVPSVDQENMSLSSGILKIMQLDPVIVKIEVNEKDLPRILPGQEATLVFDAAPGKQFTGKVRYIRPVLSATSRSATVEIQVSNPARALKPGMFADVSILLPEEEGIFIPMSAIARQAGTSQDYIYILEGNKAKRLTVKRLQSIGDQVAVEGVDPSQKVILAGKGKLMDGSVVEIKNL